MIIGKSRGCVPCCFLEVMRLQAMTRHVALQKKSCTRTDIYLVVSGPPPRVLQNLVRGRDGLEHFSVAAIITFTVRVQLHRKLAVSVLQQCVRSERAQTGLLSEGEESASPNKLYMYVPYIYEASEKKLLRRGQQIRIEVCTYRDNSGREKKHRTRVFRTMN